MKYVLLLAALALSGCHPTGPGNQSAKDSTVTGEECVFDTSTYKFTTEKLKAFKRDIIFNWNDQDKNATTKLNGNDTLVLHIGGCYHFGYDAVYTTDTLVMHKKEVVAKVKWLAQNFFGQGFEAKYIECLDNNLYTIDSSNTHSWNLEIVNEDTLTDHVYEPTSIDIVGKRLKIAMAAYQD